MPADLSKNPASSSRNRRLARKDDEDKFDNTHAREIELKRSRGEISCAECRRLKIRCDKTIPCQSCQRRGCAALCPNGSLATGQGTRFVLAATEHLHKKVAKMGERVRQLEDALAISHAKNSNEPHPLLRDGNNTSGHTAIEPDDDAIPRPESQAPNPENVIEAFGTLSVYEHGISRFFGPTGGTEYLLYTDGDSSTRGSTRSAGSKSPESVGTTIRDSLSPPISGELTRFSASFPFTPMGPVNVVLELVENYLPPWDRACHLSDAFINHAAWLFRNVSKDQIMLELLPMIYRRPQPESSPPLEDSGPHDYALMFLILAIGALVDLNQEPYNAEGEHYSQISRAALCLQPVLEKPSVITIQALHLLSVYNGMAGNEAAGETSLETTWSLTAFAIQLAHSIGLHRDSARWGLPKELVNRRRLQFWNLFVADSWNSLTTGRPPCFAREYIDCKFPDVGDEPVTDEDIEQDFGTWGFRFAFQCVAEVAARTLTAEPPSYETITDLDRKVREFPIPADAVAFLEDFKTQEPDEQLPLSLSMTRYVLSHSREVILLSIHRSFFAQAIIDSPDNPLRSQYAPSFLAAYRASTTILKAVAKQFKATPTLLTRFWPTWTYAFSASVVFGTVVTRGPKSPLATSAMTQLETACDLFERASKLSRRAARALPLLINLRQKAHYALELARNDRSHDGGAMWGVKAGEDDELEIFAGKTRLVEKFTPPSSSQASPDPPSGVPPGPEPAPSSGQYHSAPIIPPSAPNLVGMQGPSTGNWYGQGSSTTYPPPLPAQPQTVPSQGYGAPSYERTASGSSSAFSDYAWQQDQRGAQMVHGVQNHQVSRHPSMQQVAQPPEMSQPSHMNQHPPVTIPSQSSGVSLQYPYMAQQPTGQQQQQQQQQIQSSQQPHYTNHPQPESYLRDRASQFYPGASIQTGQPTFNPPEEFVSLGFASRESALDQRWNAFMAQSGFMDGVEFSHPGGPSRSQPQSQQQQHMQHQSHPHNRSHHPHNPGPSSG